MSEAISNQSFMEERFKTLYHPTHENSYFVTLTYHNLPRHFDYPKRNKMERDLRYFFMWLERDLLGRRNGKHFNRWKENIRVFYHDGDSTDSIPHFHIIFPDISNLKIKGGVYLSEEYFKYEVMRLWQKINSAGLSNRDWFLPIYDVCQKLFDYGFKDDRSLESLVIF